MLECCLFIRKVAKQRWAIIDLLPFLVLFLKTFERIVYDQLEKYKDESLLYEFLSGFRSSFSTDACLSHLFDHIRKEWDNGNYTGMVVLNLQRRSQHGESYDLAW